MLFILKSWLVTFRFQRKPLQLTDLQISVLNIVLRPLIIARTGAKLIITQESKVKIAVGLRIVWVDSKIVNATSPGDMPRIHGSQIAWMNPQVAFQLGYSGGHIFDRAASRIDFLTSTNKGKPFSTRDLFQQRIKLDTSPTKFMLITRKYHPKIRKTN